MVLQNAVYLTTFMIFSLLKVLQLAINCHKILHILELKMRLIIFLRRQTKLLNFHIFLRNLPIIVVKGYNFTMEKRILDTNVVKQLS